MIIVHKFGGTSLANAERFQNVTDIIQKRAPTYRPLTELDTPVVVVSAMSGVTDRLVAGALAAVEGDDRSYRHVKAELLDIHLATLDSLLGHSTERLAIGGYIEDRLHELEQLYRSIALLGELTSRIRDRVTSLGEGLSANLLAAVLREQGTRAQAVSAAELIVTDKQFGAATPLMKQTKVRVKSRLRPMLDTGVVPIITGYISATEDGVMTTLGRGGSDFSAAIIGASIPADEVWIWSDVDGILTADPNYVPHAQPLEQLSYEEAAELAYYGAEVLHPKTIQPVVEIGIPLRLLNSFNSRHPGTMIMPGTLSSPKRLPAIISTTGLTKITIGNTNNGLTGWALDHPIRILQNINDAGIEVLMFWQSFSEQRFSLVIRSSDQGHCMSAIRRQLDGNFSLEMQEQVATISIVGTPDWNGSGIVSHTFTALGKYGVRIIAIAQAAREHSVSICIPEDQSRETVRYLHNELGLDKYSLN